MIRGPADEDMSVRRHAAHLVIFSAESEQLTGQVFLKHMSAQFGPEIQAVALFVLGNISRALQVTEKRRYESRVRYVIHVLHALALERKLALYADELPAPVGRHTAAKAYLAPEAPAQILRVGVYQHKLLPHVLLGNEPHTHAQTQTQDDISARVGIVRRDIGYRLRV